MVCLQPGDPGCLRPFQVLVNRRLCDRAAAGNLPLPQSQCISESQDFLNPSHGQPFGRQCRFLPVREEPASPLCCPAPSLRPVEIVSEQSRSAFQPLAKSDRLQIEFLIGISPEP